MNSIITPAFLSSIRKSRSLPRNSWYFITATTLSILNRPDEIPKVFNDAIGGAASLADGPPSVDEQLIIARRMREALVKASAVGGLPKTINALMAMKAVTPSHLLDDPGDTSPTTRRHDVEKDSVEILERGEMFWDRIYGKISRRIMSQMERCGTEDLAVTARLMYGHILSNTQILSAPETSFVLIAGLIPQDVNPQLKGHLRGALNAGASKDEVTAVRDLVIRICEAAGMQKLDASAPGGWGWRGEIADV
ncbi:uncharacterized protein VDAG_04600 [Verticillium dahliae VdLs.17]|uniref:Carboxymuconolactone decarboxylase-like domain-containing protein n=1 Tax=Verticillium dahliae (strain VdLs.17 / ATCC MYA-4575 / FGSC 10137) TaxID=498257 RepID=G2X3L3_VERDV|nr:uncharacterized protein VDAG_04600 [Verticillium dahliae VdLs.17]EGY23162.1 hypothetical protein VDAG_04600 [Verticillium dahliae VdLs.17]KAH6682442.1 AhpD-like protein [Verticillium dahliae]KAH6689295.1 AhpD-like protein [Verticillium dahliae]